MSIFHVGDYLKNYPIGTGPLGQPKLQPKLQYIKYRKILNVSGIHVERRNVWAYLEIDRIYDIEIIVFTICPKQRQSVVVQNNELFVNLKFEPGHFRYLTSLLRPGSRVASVLRIA